MRRLAVITAVPVCAVVLIIALSVGRGARDYNVAAVFDSADGIVPGQQVKIAGTVVGSVTAVDLAAGPTARIVMSVEQRFAPFHADATCTILPEGLISENFVACDPGRDDARALARGSGGIPTVARARTTVPYSLQDVLNVLSVPTDQRIAVLLSQLGIGTSGRGEDLNGLLRRANPALQQSQRVLDILDAQRAQIGAAVGQTDAIVASLARTSGQVRAMLAHAATVTRTLADRHDDLAHAVARLPAMLSAVRPGLRALDHAAQHATPLVNELHDSAPGLAQAARIVPRFTAAGTPALRALAGATEAGLPAVRHAAPVTAKLNAASRPLASLAPSLSAFLVSLRDTGGFEGILRIAYALASSISLYDDTSHIINFLITAAPLCIAGGVANVSVPACDHQYNAPGKGEIPVNEPACGAQDPTWFTARCPAAPGAIALRKPGEDGAVAQLQSLAGSALAGHPTQPRTLRSLLDYLLR